MICSPNEFSALFLNFFHKNNPVMAGDVQLPTCDHQRGKMTSAAFRQRAFPAILAGSWMDALHLALIPST